MAIIKIWSTKGLRRNRTLGLRRRTALTYLKRLKHASVIPESAFWGPSLIRHSLFFRPHSLSAAGGHLVNELRVGASLISWGWLQAPELDKRVTPALRDLAGLSPATYGKPARTQVPAATISGEAFPAGNTPCKVKS